MLISLFATSDLARRVAERSLKTGSFTLFLSSEAKLASRPILSRDSFNGDGQSGFSPAQIFHRASRYLRRCRVLLSSRNSDGVMPKARLIFSSVYNVTFCGEFL